MATALITGASSGIGRAVAHQLLDDGWGVIGVARRTDTMPARITPVSLDLGDPGAIARAFGREPLSGAPVRLFVHCAGYGSFAPVELTALADAERQLQVNVLSAAGIVQQLLPGMRESGGRIVLVSSIASRFSSPMGGWYHASKAALDSLADTLRLEVAPFGIDVVVVQPGRVDTPWHETALADLETRTAGTEYARAGRATAAYHRKAPAAMVQPLDDAAAAVVRAATTARPRIRYVIGPGSRMAITLPQLLPARWWDRLTARAFGISGS